MLSNIWKFHKKLSSLRPISFFSHFSLFFFSQLCLSNSTPSSISSTSPSPYASLYHSNPTVWSTEWKLKSLSYSNIAGKVENLVSKMMEPATPSSENISNLSLVFFLDYHDAISQFSLKVFFWEGKRYKFSWTLQLCLWQLSNQHQGKNMPPALLLWNLHKQVNGNSNLIRQDRLGQNSEDILRGV